MELHGEKIAEGRTTHVQHFKLGNCTSHTCDQGEAMLHIQMNGWVGDTPDDPTFVYEVYNGSGELLEEQQEGYAYNIEGSHYFDAFLCLNPSDCYTVFIAKYASYQVDFNNTLVGRGYSGLDMSVFKVGEGNCPVCESKPLLIDSTSYKRSHEIMSVIAMISGMEVFMDTDSPQYQAACWVIYDDPYQVTAAHSSLVQRNILALLYFSTNGWDWSTKLSFLSPISECQWNWIYWSGVECNENGYVVTINLCKSDNVNLSTNCISFIIHHQYLLIVTFLINQMVTTSKEF